MIGHIKSGQYKKNIARAILKKYCPPHKARGIHDFILATKSSVWIIIHNPVTVHRYGDNLSLCYTFMWISGYVTLEYSDSDLEIIYLDKNLQIITK